MRFNIISSGSKGNATIVTYRKSVLLIDMGITLTRLEEGLAELNLQVKDINGAIFTHDHADHINGVRFISPNIQYALEGTLPSSLSNVIHLWEEFTIGDFKITPVLTSHDATNPCGYFIKAGNETMLYVTDTGFMPEETIKFAKNPTYLIIECNHDIQMLLNTSRPHELKERILSNHGHLCNEDSAIATCEIIGPDTKEIYLAHISEEANTPECALEGYHKIFRHFGMNLDNYIVKVANQHHSTLGGHNED